MGWITDSDNDLIRAFSNYEYNMKLDLVNSTTNDSNVFIYNGYELVINQYGGNMQNQGGSESISDNMKKLRFADVHMGHASCELMSTYNAMKLADVIPNDGCTKSFFALSLEFEINNLYILSNGYFGSNHVYSQYTPYSDGYYSSIKYFISKGNNKYDIGYILY